MMVDVGIMAVAVWIGCFIVIAVDSVYRKISPVFWRVAGLFGGPFALMVYAFVRERTNR
jgi:hypothetical protein